MSFLGRLRTRIPGRDDSGAVLIMFAVMLPAMIGFSGLVIDIGNWFEHRRHLQVRATAGALAGAGSFLVPCSASINGDIRKAAEDYSGVVHNQNLPQTAPANVHRRLNSRRWPKSATAYQDSPVDDDPRFSTPPADDFCEKGVLDVKLAETDLPWFLRAARVVPFINAHARAEIRKGTFSSSEALPVGVPDPNPKKARAYFVDEDTGDVLGPSEGVPLVNKGPTGGLTRWDNADAPVAVPISKPHVGVRIALSGSTSVTCGQPLVACYDAGAATKGLVHIRGYSPKGSGSKTAPIARDVRLLPGASGGCADPYFTSVACSVRVQASVDFGTDDPTASDFGAKLDATVGGSPPKKALTYSSTDKLWTSGDILVNTDAGPIEIELDWETGKGSDKATGKFGLVQRPFGAVDNRSGPIKLATVSELGKPLEYANSFPRCVDEGDSCTRDLIVTIGVTNAFGAVAVSVSDPVVELRITGSHGSSTQQLDCDSDVPNIKTELWKGCHTRYRENTGEACPTNLLGLTEPYPCVPVQPGEATNEVAKGMNLRVLGVEKPTTCPDDKVNNWAAYPNFAADDPRIVEVFLVPFGAFADSGSYTVPVITFGSFYVTGWRGEGGGFENPCQTKGDDVPDNKGSIVGHFIKRIDKVNSGGATEEKCDYTVLGPCVAVLTR